MAHVDQITHGWERCFVIAYATCHVYVYTHSEAQHWSGALTHDSRSACALLYQITVHLLQPHKADQILYPVSSSDSVLCIQY